MNNTASKNEPNVEAPLLQLPLVAGRLWPWRQGGSLDVGAIAKFRPKEIDPLTRWVVGAQFRVAVKRAVYTVTVQRYLPTKHVQETAGLVSGGRYGKRWLTTPASTMPELVVVHVESVEVAK